MTPPTTIVRADVSLATAEALLEAVRQDAETSGPAMAAAVPDAGGHLVAAMRMDGVALRAPPVAIDKAFSAVAWAAPTGLWFELSQPGQPGWGWRACSPGVRSSSPGACPCHAAGLIGGLGVSGSTPDDDARCAQAAVAALGLETT